MHTFTNYVRPCILFSIVLDVHSLSVSWFFQNSPTNSFPFLSLRWSWMWRDFFVFSQIIRECCAIMMWCYDLVLGKFSYFSNIYEATRHFYSCMARKRKKMLEKAKMYVHFHIVVFQHFILSQFFVCVPVDLMFITMSWIFFHYKTSRKKGRKDVEGKGIIKKNLKSLANERKQKDIVYRGENIKGSFVELRHKHIWIEVNGWRSCL